MKKYTSVGLVTLGLALSTLGAIGPVTDLQIMNRDIAPDGFTRPAVLAGGIFPGPLITGQKVRQTYFFLLLVNLMSCFRRGMSSKLMS